jgi:hypothetical protein
VLLVVQPLVLVVSVRSFVVPQTHEQLCMEQF